MAFVSCHRWCRPSSLFDQCLHGQVFATPGRFYRSIHDHSIPVLDHHTSGTLSEEQRFCCLPKLRTDIWWKRWSHGGAFFSDPAVLFAPWI